MNLLKIFVLDQEKYLLTVYLQVRPAPVSLLLVFSRDSADETIVSPSSVVLTEIHIIHRRKVLKCAINIFPVALREAGLAEGPGSRKL